MNKNQNHNQNIGTNDIFYRPPYTMNGTDDQCPGTAVCQQPRKGTKKRLHRFRRQNLLVTNL